MPTYNFKCPKCQHELSDIFPMKDYDGKRLLCPNCGNKGLVQVFKGSFSMTTRGKNSTCPSGTCPLIKKRG